VASGNLTKGASLAAHIGARSLVALLHKLLKIVLIAVHSVSPQRSFSQEFVDCLNAHRHETSCPPQERVLAGGVDLTRLLVRFLHQTRACDPRVPSRMYAGW